MKAHRYHFQNCSGDIEPLTEGYLHEMLDRIHNIRGFVDISLVQHPAEILLRDRLLDLDNLLGEMYQYIGAVMHEIEDKNEET